MVSVVDRDLSPFVNRELRCSGCDRHGVDELAREYDEDYEDSWQMA
jgi:hypothetical protein